MFLLVTLRYLKLLSRVYMYRIHTILSVKKVLSEPNSKSSFKQFGRTECLVGHYCIVASSDVGNQFLVKRSQYIRIKIALHIQSKKAYMCKWDVLELGTLRYALIKSSVWSLLEDSKSSIQKIQKRKITSDLFPMFLFVHVKPTTYKT